MFSKILILFTLLAPLSAIGAVQPIYQDIKPPTQKMIEKQSWAAPAAANSTVILSNVAGPTSAAAATITSFAAQPDFARNITISPGGNYSVINSCAIVVSGTNYLGHAISETLTAGAGVSTQLVGAKAFQTITSVAFPASCESSAFGATWSMGYSTALGIKRCMDDAAGLLHGAANGTKEATAPTMAVAVNNGASVESNTAIFNTALNGARNFDLYFMQNFKCTY